MSAEPQSRAVLDGHSNSLVAQYDIHLKILGDRYLSFFRERKKIEEIYVDSLRTLYRKVKVVDAFFDSRIEPGTTEAAWNEVKENLERETRTRQAFINTLAVDVINPLTTLKDTHDRARKRVKDDLKESAVTYADYAENTLPKLKRAYFKKSQEYESQGANQAPNFLEPPPTRDRKSSGSGPQNRTKPTALLFSDLAHHGRKHLNQFVTRLDRDGSIAGGSLDLAARSARAKQEAEVADNEYRKAVYWLWGLRSRRVKVLENGYHILERIAFRTTEAVKKVLVKYADTTVTTCTTHNDLTIRARSAAEKISAETDTSVLAASLRASLAISIPPRTLYYNYDVGECSDLVFGVSLADYAIDQESENNVPNILRLCIEEIDRRGLDVEGIYMLSGKHAHVQQLQRKVERDEKSFSFNSDTDDIHTVASLLKFYLKGLPEPLFSSPLQERIQDSRDLASHAVNDFVLLRSRTHVLRSRIHGLPAVHRASLGALLRHLSRVASHSNKNGMNSKKLAPIFAPVVFGNDEILQGDFWNGQSQDSVMETLIDNAHILLDECPPVSSSPTSPIYPRGQTPVLDDEEASFTIVEFPSFGDLTPQPHLRPLSRKKSPESHHASKLSTSIPPSASTPRPLSPARSLESRYASTLSTSMSPSGSSLRSLSPTRSLESLYASTLSTPSMSPLGSSASEDLSEGHTPTQTPASTQRLAPLLPQLPDFSTLQIFTESARSELPVQLQVFPHDAMGIDVADSTSNLRPRPASSINTTPDRSNSSIPRPRSAINLLRRPSTGAILRPLISDSSPLRIYTNTQEEPSREQDVTRLDIGNAERTGNSSKVSLVPSLPRFAPQQRRRPSPLYSPGTESTRTTVTDYCLSSATSLASGDFAFPGSSNFNDG